VNFLAERHAARRQLQYRISSRVSCAFVWSFFN